MKFENHSLLISIEALLNEKLQPVRGQRVFIDTEVASILEISLEHLQQKVRTNIERFPQEFMFSLTHVEMVQLFSKKTKRKKICAFTWGGLMMLAGLMNSTRAIEIHLQLIRCYGKGVFSKIDLGG